MSTMRMSNAGDVVSPEELRRQADVQRQVDARAGRKPTPGVPVAAFGDPTKPIVTEPAQPAPAKLSELEALLDARRGELVNLPVLGAAYVAIVPHPQMNEVEAALVREMTRLGLPQTAEFTATTWDIERKARILDVAVRKADDPTHRTALLPPGAWYSGRVDDDLIVACFEVYRDVRARLDPIGVGSLSDEEFAVILDAFKKKDGTTLASFGAVKLTLWLLTTDALQLTSPTPASSPGT